MRIGIFAKTYDDADPQTVLSACRTSGFECVQYNMACSGLGSLPDTIPTDVVSELNAAAHATGVSIDAISATYNMTDPDLDRRKTGRAAFAAIAKCASVVGSPIVTVCSGSLDAHDKWRYHRSNDNPASWTEMCREFDMLCEIAEANEILIGVEPEPANIVCSAARAIDLLASFPGSPIRIVLDPANLIEDVTPDRHKSIIDDALDQLGSMIALVHAKDRFVDGRVAAAGKGVVDWSYLLRSLAACGFDGSLVAHGMTAVEAPGVANFLATELRQIAD
ncbi:MAG: sugar phosphate isomerase/epimerase [Woeseiaceae bacterium]|nr:sugar phosphate isomerase/epimerase [Woeseiaceae bacterium]